MVKKDRSSFVNKTYLFIMLPLFYQTHLESQLSLAEYLFLKLLITLLQSIKEVSLETLATTLLFGIRDHCRDTLPCCQSWVVATLMNRKRSFLKFYPFLRIIKSAY